jgi:thymidylate synthase ThyX
MQLRYPRCIHAEVLTHRVFSRNSSSSRAIPVKRLIQDVIDDPFIPVHWGKNEPGMQAREEHDADIGVYLPIEAASFGYSREKGWLVARDYAVEFAKAFAESGYHKQLVNRLLEPFAHINVVVTSTQWANFFSLRDHEDAEPHIALLAKAMKEARDASKPDMLKYNEWHLPYIMEEDREWVKNQEIKTISYPHVGGMDDMMLIKMSVARCARVSYLTHDGIKPNIENDLKLYDRLVGSIPLHASPAEHQATPDMIALHSREFITPELHGNLIGWKQFRKLLPKECVHDNYN